MPIEFHKLPMNPTGVTLALERQQRLVELADRYGVPLIENDPYGQLRYEEEHLPPLVVLLNFSNATPARIEEGIQRLGSVLECALGPSAAVAELHNDHVEHRGKCFPMASGRTLACFDGQEDS